MRSRLPLALLLLAAPSAQGEERELVLALHPGAAVATADGKTAWGGGGGLDLGYGLTDALALRVTGSFTAHSLAATSSGPAGAMLAYHVGVGLTYAIDIVRLVPYVDFALGLVGVRRPGETEPLVDNHLGLEIGLGVDYLLTRRFAVGFVVRYHADLMALPSLPLYFYFGPRLAIHLPI